MSNNSTAANIRAAAPSLAVVARPAKSERVMILSALIILAWLFLTTMLALSQWTLPAVPNSPPIASFSAERAAAHLAKIAERPHPVGSAEEDKVRAYITGELSNISLHPEIQPSQILVGAQVINVQNIEATIPGSEDRPYILLVAHYDSVANSPGAADDGSGVVTLLEVARAIQASPGLRSPVMLLFSDSEERGLAGAKAFVTRTALVKKIGLVINLDARGDSGPAFMFETQDKPGTMVNQFAQAVSIPVANSFMPELYRRLSNDTDFSVFRRAGIPGFNFAFINNLVSYHSAVDSFNALDMRSLQHLGDSVTALVRQFGMDSHPARRQNVVYFNLLRGLLVVYPASWSIPLAVLSAMVLAAALWVGFKYQRLGANGIIVGFIASGSLFVLVPCLAWLAWKLILLVHGQYALVPNGDSYHSMDYHIAIAALAVASIAAVYVWLLRRNTIENLWAGALIWFALISLVSSVLMPGASYLFSWPLLFLAAGFMVVNKAGWNPYSLISIAVIAVLAVPAILLLAPAAQMLFWVFPLSFTALPVLFLTFMVMLLLPQMAALIRWRRWSVSLVAAAICVTFLIAGAWTAKPSAAGPIPSNLIYVENAGSRTASWVTRTGPDYWNSHFIGKLAKRQPCATLVPTMAGPCWSGPAEYVEAKPSAVQVVQDQNFGGVRTLHLRLLSPAHSAIITLIIDPSVKILSAAANGQPLLTKSGAPASGLQLAFIAPREQGEELVCTVQASDPLRVTLIDQSYGLESLPGFTPRPAQVIPGGRESDSMFLEQRLTF